jgi:hypothetical protein
MKRRGKQKTERGLKLKTKLFLRVYVMNIILPGLVEFVVVITINVIGMFLNFQIFSNDTR